MINKKHLVLEYWSDVTLKMSKGTCLFFFFLIIIAVEAGAILISYKIVPGYQAFVIVNVKDFICKIYALFKHEAHV